MSKRRLAYLCLETPREGQAVHTHVHEIIRGLTASGWHVDLFASSRGGASTGTPYVSRIVDYGRVLWRLYRVLNKFNAIYVRAHFAALPLTLVARRRAIPVFQEVNGKPQDLGVTYRWLKPLLGVLAWSYNLQLRGASHVFAVTRGLVDWVRGAAGHNRVSLIPNAANTDLFCPEGPREAIAGDYVIFVGGLVAWHGITTMLAAVRSREWPPGTRLIIVGDGIERAKVEAAAQREPMVAWFGHRSYREVATFLRGAIAALCVIENPDGRSAAGVAPLKLFEALACGVPVIVSDLPFQADLVRLHDVGVVVPAASPDALARAVAKLVAHQSEAREMGRRGTAYVQAHASWTARAAETGDMMARVIDGIA